MGSKARHADEIIKVASAHREPGSIWIEPFVGGGNVICRVNPEHGPRIGADKNKYMIALLDALGNRGWQPPRTMTKEEYKKIERSPDAYPPELVAFVATGCSFGSLWFRSFVAENEDAGIGFVGEEQSEILGFSRCRQSADSCLRDAPGLRGVKFIASSYDHLDVPPGALVYCDPPYAGTTEYGATKKVKISVGESLAQNEWNRVKFWKWTDRLVASGHQVFVSEYAGPPPSIYNISDVALLDEARAIKSGYASLQARKQAGGVPPTPEEYEALLARRRDLDRRETEERARLAARWGVVWSKDVVSDFSPDRGTGTAKQETELLLHREP